MNLAADSGAGSVREVLVVVHDVSAKSAFELALIENVQREDLDPIEFAEALDRLIKEYPQSPFIQEIPAQDDQATPTQKAGK